MCSHFSLWMLCEAWSPPLRNTVSLGRTGEGVGARCAFEGYSLGHAREHGQEYGGERDRQGGPASAR
jgi:hypothetical protein